jgi:hypothetical protein
LKPEGKIFFLSLCAKRKESSNKKKKGKYIEGGKRGFIRPN